jgi:hypothetical protein
MTPTPIGTILVAAAVALGFVAAIVIAYGFLSRRSDAELNRLRAEYEASTAPYYAAIIRTSRAKQAERVAAAQDQATTESTTP